jgi:hypothetical protein
MAPAATQEILADPIDQLIADLSASDGWFAGSFMQLGLPEGASPKDVVRAFCAAGDERGPVENYSILKIRQVNIPNGLGSGLYSAAIIQTKSGKMIVLMQYNDGDCWTRGYDIKPSSNNAQQPSATAP